MPVRLVSSVLCSALVMGCYMACVCWGEAFGRRFWIGDQFGGFKLQRHLKHLRRQWSSAAGLLLCERGLDRSVHLVPARRFCFFRTIQVIASLPDHVKKQVIEAAKRRQRMRSRAQYMPVAGNPAMYSQTQLSNFLRSKQLNSQVRRVLRRRQLAGVHLCLV